MSRDLLAHKALADIPKLLTLQDRNPHSPTYGCFDRSHWHYKIVDFPSGMAQEFVWPLALAYDSDVPSNPYYRQPAIREWAEAGIRYAARSAHRDGSCDDYYPFERALGAAAFTLLACVESYPLLGMRDDGALAFLERRADWLAHHDESGRLANHQALVVLGLARASSLLNTSKWRALIDARLRQLLSWQSREGWFAEYEGFDPGYHTLTISILARMHQLRPDDAIESALVRAIRLAAEFVHPDGSHGGEYASRGTYSFFPHGFELAGAWMPDALGINDRFLAGLARGLEACFADDHIIGHHAWNYLLAWRDFEPRRPAISPRVAGRLHLEDGGILVDRRDGSELVIGLNKGGVFKYFRDAALVASDTQVSLQVRAGRRVRNAVAHLKGDYRTRVDSDEVVVEGTFGWAKHRQMTTLNLLILRAAMFTVGRFFPNLIRRLLQSMLITDAKPAPFTFRRSFRWHAGAWDVTDEIAAVSWTAVLGAGLGASQTSAYVAMSRTFQGGQMQQWVDLTDAVRGLGPGEPLRIARRL